MRNPSQITIDKKAVSRNFNRAADSYEHASFVPNEVGDRLFERLEYIKINPQNILDLGSGTGIFSQKLLLKYPKANIFSADIAEEMLHFAKKSKNMDASKILSLCADAEKLPILSHSIDLIFSNCCFHWCYDLITLFSECRRILKPGGLLLFSTFGPDTLIELREILGKLDPDNQHVNIFLDMHDIGDILLHAGFEDPVMDMERLTLLYQDVSELLRDLKLSGENLSTTRFIKIIEDRENERNNNYVSNQNIPFQNPYNRNLNTKQLSAEYAIYQNEDGLIPATFEIVFGHAFLGKDTDNSDFAANESTNDISKTMPTRKTLPLKISMKEECSGHN